ncbi:hypothetical protein AGABI1DRAFT_97913 [Agaricus bisporus var. burnettii JB137-S8]|uniref:Uncharacterized protein n=1 Tax=Agaricus bisporus var. burnettii (strain JB137-S8 / ATCC MYA-4627 / FGSC 10392) TaxID=597362 RepID=K5W805_AGABU|nr:hypothetical protein AGABI2DRAFT_64503 [Agaricus bisporus var. bisporus H97]XP_007326857.1 uncharacterized protein AGABI1DRAFT_97913 [Agaricus bisporus var. burnettii JB137-S8]EKM82989.1 hypothetical protein AGABI1DRAFT_97913 [Agaricus bisporus var. burnettii JB137-S8]EKV50420.1 hypothetical protein AGABI2DRAFT_64503 [Agaricus bisporus var. bisporus H97]
MGGPNLEVFKFSLYLFIPIVALVHFGDPEWYRQNVIPYKWKLFPPPERTNQNIPKETLAIREELDRIKSERLSRRVAKEAEVNTRDN